MAIVWQKQIGDTHYQVRSAGNSIRLYTNGVFHTQYNDRHPVTGAVWDLLLLPAFFSPKETIQRVLLLGVGGGAVIRQLQHFLQPAHIVGVELSETHITIAKQFFSVTHPSIELVQADAVQWLEQYQGEPFDLIIDDLYGDNDGEPERAVPFNQHWCEKLTRHLSDTGVLVANFISLEEAMESLLAVDRTVTKNFTNGFYLRCPHYDNAVMALTRLPSSSKALRETLNQIPGLSPKNKTSRLKYSIRQLANFDAKL